MNERNVPYTIVLQNFVKAKLRRMTDDDDQEGLAEIEALMTRIAEDPLDPILGGIHESREIKNKDAEIFQKLVGKPLLGVIHIAPTLNVKRDITIMFVGDKAIILIDTEYDSLLEAVEANSDLLKEAGPVSLTSYFQGFTFEGVEQKQGRLSFTIKQNNKALHFLSRSYIL